MANIKCKISRPGQGVKGLQVVAFEEVTLPAKDTPGYIRSSSKMIRQVGKAITDNKGNCKIQFTKGDLDEGVSPVKSKVFIRVYEGETEIGESSKINIDDLLTFIYEIAFKEPDNLTVITVLNGSNEPVAGAEIFWKQLSRGKTDSMGHLVLKDVKAGDKIAARLLQHENTTSRHHHDNLSDQNWNYRVYITSVPVRYNDNGDDVRMPLHVVNDPREEQVIQISRNNAQVALNLLVSFEWDTDLHELMYYRDRFFEVSELLYNATDGQFLIEFLDIVDNKTFWEDADYRIYANNDQRSYTYRNSFFGNTEHIHMNPFDALNPGALLHELGHYAFGLRDEANGIDGCTLKGVNGMTGTVFSEGGEKEACIMRGDAIQYRSLKICSGHPDNPHAETTSQGDQDCWTTIRNRYNDAALWRIKTPQSRNVIPGRLPDSGVPMPTITTRSPWTGAQAASYIPIFSWKPQWIFDDTWGRDECINLKVRILYYGEPEHHARVTLKDSTGRTILQGYTGEKDAPYRDGLVQGDGEIIIRGAHKCDQITVTSHRLLIIETILVSGSNLVLEFNFEGWEG